MKTAIAQEAKSEILEGLKHLQYSYNKVQSLSNDPSKLSSEDLETWEGLIARFGRVADIYLSKYLRSMVLLADPGFRGTVRDVLDQAEKMQLIDDVPTWMEIRELRNSSVHEYSKLKIPLIFEAIKNKTPLLLKIGTKLK